MKIPEAVSAPSASGSTLRMGPRWLNWPAPARRAAAFVYGACITWLLLAPAATFEDIGALFPGQDKVVHLVIFAGFSGLIRWCLPRWWSGGKRGAILIALLLAYGAGIEILQPQVPGAGRSFEWLDLLLDGAGVIAGKRLCERMAA